MKRVESDTLELDLIIEQLDKHTPEEVFGAGPKDAARRVWLKLLHATHPDKFNRMSKEIQDKAEKASKRINELWAQAEARFTAGIYGEVSKKLHTGPVVITTKKAVYVVGSKIASGGTAGIFVADLQTKGTSVPALLKIPNSIRDNDLIDLEATNLKKIREFIRKSKGTPEDKKRLEGFFPRLLETVNAGDRKINAFEFEDGWYTLEQIKQKHPVLDPRIAVFIMNRILTALTVTHLSGLAHGGVSPKHVLIHAESHKGRLIDWTLAGPKMLYRDKEMDSFTAPEVLKSRVATRSSDLYGAAMCFVYLLGDVSKMEISGIDPRITEVLNRCLQPHIRNRFPSVEKLTDEFRGAVQNVFGPPLFVTLEM